MIVIDGKDILESLSDQRYDWESPDPIFYRVLNEYGKTLADLIANRVLERLEEKKNVESGVR